MSQPDSLLYLHYKRRHLSVLAIWQLYFTQELFKDIFLDELLIKYQINIAPVKILKPSARSPS
ncbi:MAG: hypothetical protein HY785_18670 [Oscillatoriophycideae cyanobacterium NC_groundwater_1537_Pr4_S-0.65um_50_18]|nr:hypothetical protein [Oscillatoriophycideae cyanobacterium NC_groundwater_1537_Pr4_S-0.65um_50_18]